MPNARAHPQSGHTRSGRATFGLIAIGMVVALVAFGAYLLRDPLPHFLERRSQLARVEPGESLDSAGYRLTTIRVVATSGLAVELTVRRPLADSGRLPLAVILGGHYGSRGAMRFLGETPGVMVATLSYPFTGDPRPDALTFLRDIPKIRGAFLDTPPAVMLALDYLTSLPDVDPRRIEAVGVSLGAPFMCIAGALDPTVRSRVGAARFGRLVRPAGSEHEAQHSVRPAANGRGGTRKRDHRGAEDSTRCAGFRGSRRARS